MVSPLLEQSKTQLEKGPDMRNKLIDLNNHLSDHGQATGM